MQVGADGGTGKIVRRPPISSPPNHAFSIHCPFPRPRFALPEFLKLMKMADSFLERVCSSREVFTTRRVHLVALLHGCRAPLIFLRRRMHNAIFALRLPRREHAMEFVPNEISPVVDVYPFVMNVEGVEMPFLERAVEIPPVLGWDGWCKSI